MSFSFESLALVAMLQRLLEIQGWSDYSPVQHTGIDDLVLLPIEGNGIVAGYTIRLKQYRYYLNGTKRSIWLGASDVQKKLIWRVDESPSRGSFSE